MEWSEENVLKLIQIYKTKSLLWDPKHEEHFKKNLKEDAWREISTEMNTSADQCKRKMISMLASYRRERNKIKSSKAKGKDRIYVSRWFAYKAFKFLEARNLSGKKLPLETCAIHGIEDDCETEVTPSEQRKQEETALSPTLTSCKRAKRKEDDMNSVADISKNTAKKLDKQPSYSKEIDLFFTYVAAKVHKYSSEAQKAVQHAVFDILMKADKGMFDWPAQHYPHSYNWQNPAESGPTPPTYSHPHFSQCEQAVTPPIHSPSESSLSNRSTQQSPAPSITPEIIEDF
ncbi:MADF domain-containing protein [Nephila pilipes]|uniref:MADF domain-containing protein n=1 Tax=Nephila pilipes TaxID=299642 RepID=A0A8X6QYA7_NEPPI|nr:MADF domain-containing protein [Nephila pilipes]